MVLAASPDAPVATVGHVPRTLSDVADRRRLSPEDRRSELLALGAEVFGQRPYDEVRIDEIAERAGVSRALMYHYFPDKRAFFAAVVRAEGERLFEATNTPPRPDLSLFEQLRAGVMAYLDYDEAHPHGAWAAYMGMGRSDPVLRGIDPTGTTTARPTASSDASRSHWASRWMQESSAICGRSSTAGWHSPSRCVASGSSTRRSMRVPSPTRARTRCSMPWRACLASRPSLE